MSPIKLLIRNNISEEADVRVYEDVGTKPPFHTLSGSGSSTTFSATSGAYFAIKTDIGVNYSLESNGQTSLRLSHETTLSAGKHLINVFAISYPTISDETGDKSIEGNNNKSDEGDIEISHERPGHG